MLIILNVMWYKIQKDVQISDMSWRNSTILSDGVVNNSPSNCKMFIRRKWQRWLRRKKRGKCAERKTTKRNGTHIALSICIEFECSILLCNRNWSCRMLLINVNRNAEKPCVSSTKNAIILNWVGHFAERNSWSQFSWFLFSSDEHSTAQHSSMHMVA